MMCDEMKRRSFFASAAGALVAARSAQAATATITVIPGETIGAVSPLLHSHFVEHLGGVVYDGIWVGEGSKIPNTGGIRNAIVDALKRIQAPLFRWPGGCFADSYHWKDGIGPRDQRPKRSNFWINDRLLYDRAGTHPAVYDTNAFGTNEFLRFCQQVGGKAYIAANVRSGTAREFYEWVEYCNAPSNATTFSTMRGAEPFNVEYWGIGNESWGCGGDMTPEEYSLEFRKFTSWTPRFGVPHKYIATGPNGFDTNWSRGFLEGLIRKNRGLLNRVWGFGLHYYCGTVGKGQAVDFTTDDWYDLLERANRMDGLISQHWNVMGEFDRERRVKLAIDEWGTWHRAGSEVAPHHLLGQQSTMRDALIAALTLDTFNRHAEKLVMSNIAQLVNCLQSLFLAHEDKFLLTPVYHVFDMYQGHKGGFAVKTAVDAELGRRVPNCMASATMKGGKLLVTAVNSSHDQPLDAVVALRGYQPAAATARVLSGKLQAHNTFAAPDQVKPVAAPAAVSGREIRLTLPASSVASIEITLG
jgi:alpha-N-arabinofuranosidase